MRRWLLAGALVLTAGLAAGLAAARPATAADPDVVRARLRATADAVVAEVTIAPGWHVNAHAPRDEFLVPTTLEVSPPPGVTVGTVRYPEPVERRLEFTGGVPALLYEGTVTFSASLAGAAAPGTAPLHAQLRYQACSDTRCLPPRTLALGVSETAAGAPNQIGDWVARWGWGVTLLWIVLLGAALNLTPCVYPLISVTVAFFGGASGRDARRAPWHALAYVLGICVTFSALGVAAALTGSLFGAALQRPAVLGTIALVMVALALSNFGLYQLRLPSGLVRWAGQVGEGALGAFFMGLTMGVVAAPCIGPVVAALLLYVGARQSAPLGFALFFALGVGMGAPYVALAAVAGRLRRLPRGGAWLAWMEWLFGFLLLGTALHFAAPLLPAAWVPFAWTLLLASAGVVLGFFGSNRSAVVGWARAAVGLATIGLGLSSLLVAAVQSPIPWEPFSDDALARAVAAGRPVLLDFEADWCLPCREMDRTTFRDPAVVRAARAFATLKVDATADDGDVKATLARFKVPGVPTYVFLGPDGQERRRLVGYVAAEEMLRVMGAAAPGAEPVVEPGVERTRG